MKRNPVHFGVFLCALLSLTSCVTPREGIGPWGDTVTVTTQETSSFTAELLLVSDTTLYFYAEDYPPTQRIFGVPVDAIESIEVEGYVNKNWIAAVVAFEVVPAILLGIAAAQVEDSGAGGVFAVSMVPAALTTLAFATSTGKAPGASAPLSSRAVEELRKYARFPLGLLPEQFENLLRGHGQSDVSLQPLAL